MSLHGTWSPGVKPMHTRIVLVYTCTNPVTKHLFLSFLAIANLGLYLFFIVNHYLDGNSRIMLYSSSAVILHCIIQGVPSGHIYHFWSFCSGQCCSRCPMVIGLFSQEHILDWLIFLFKYNALLVFITF